MGAIFPFLLIPVDGKTQDKQQAVKSNRSRDGFDESWQFHKGYIAMQRSIKASGQVPVQTAKNSREIRLKATSGKLKSMDIVIKSE